LQGFQGFNRDDQEWIQVWFKRLSHETELAKFFEPAGLAELGQALTAMSVEDPERFRRFSTEVMPEVLGMLCASDRDEHAWETLFDSVMDRFPEMEAMDRGQILWLLRQLSETDALIHKLKKTLESGEIDFTKGLENWRTDVLNGSILPDTLRPDAFQLGKNLAATPGDVVFENQLFQLIQYHPRTVQVHANPILLIPAYVNRFYILDLSEEYSMVRWLLDQGHTVFLMSWVNPTDLLANYDMTHYVLDGALTAVDQIERMTPESKIQLMGYCAGGVIATILTAWMKARNDHRVVSLTLLTTLLDYSDAGPLGQLVSRERIDALKKPLTDLGYLPAELMLRTFASLRPHDLLFGRILNSYVFGERAKPFPLLHWLGDGTRTPAALVLWTLEHLYLENRLVGANPFVLAGQHIDLKQIDIPVFVMAAENDDISPWQGVVAVHDAFAGPLTLVLGKGGHNSGVVNPPSHCRHDHVRLDLSDPLDLDHATQIQGSWWVSWRDFLVTTAGAMGGVIGPGGGIRPIIEPAPGRYVRQP
jgi:polyhydroxyalkanoate synthase subunit PhaC